MTSSTDTSENYNIKRSLIVARAKNGVIGRDGDMPWRLSSDLKRFKALTSGKPVIMGRKTWESLPKRPLPKRPNIVASRNADYEVKDAWLASGLPAAYALAIAMAKKSGVDEVFVIGGAGLYQDAIAHADCLHITEVQADTKSLNGVQTSFRVASRFGLFLSSQASANSGSQLITSSQIASASSEEGVPCSESFTSRFREFSLSGRLSAT